MIHDKDVNYENSRRFFVSSMLDILIYTMWLCDESARNTTIIQISFILFKRVTHMLANVLRMHTFYVYVSLHSWQLATYLFHIYKFVCIWQTLYFLMYLLHILHTHITLLFARGQWQQPTTAAVIHTLCQSEQPKKKKNYAQDVVLVWTKELYFGGDDVWVRFTCINNKSATWTLNNEYIC